MSRQLVYCSVIVIWMAMLVNHGALSFFRRHFCREDGYGLVLDDNGNHNVNTCDKCPNGTFIEKASMKCFARRSNNNENKCHNRCIKCSFYMKGSVAFEEPSYKNYLEICGCQENFYRLKLEKRLVGGEEVDNYICRPCPPGTTSPPRSTSASHCTGRTYEEQLSAQNQLLGQVTKTLSASKNAENNMNAGLVTKLQRMWATNEVRKKYDEMRAEHASKYQIHGEEACRHEAKKEKGDKTERHMHVFAAVRLNEEVAENTCLSTNRDELIQSFCKFRSQIDETLANQKITKKGKDFWPNICCASNGETCKVPEGVKADKMVPFALAQGGKVTKAALYGEILDVLRSKGHKHHPNGGYLLRGMLNVLDEVKDVDGAEELKTEIVDVFKHIHLCGPKVFTSPESEGVTMCQLFHPYGQLMASFHSKFKDLFVSRDVNNVLARQESKATLLLQLSTANQKRVKKQLNKLREGMDRLSKKTAMNKETDNICRLPLGKKTEVDAMKETFCSMYQPFDSTDDKSRITNFAMFYIRDDIGRDDLKFGEVLSKRARFVADDKCYRASPMFTGDDFSLQTVERMGGTKELVLVAKLDSSAKSYLRADAGNCDGTEWLPRVTLKFGIYVDKNNCCAKTNNIASCQRCSSKNAPKPVDHHYTKEQLFYEMTVTGNAFELTLDGNPILAGTKYTLLVKPNSVKPKSADVGKKLMTAINRVVADKKKTNNDNEETRRRRRLVGYSDDWNEFTTYVETAQGTCNSHILQDVSVYDDGTFSFHCSQAAALCNCIQHVGGSGEEQHFVAGNIGLIVFRQDGLVGYEITEDGEALVYGDVNEGRMDRRRRRRRLLGNSRNGGS